MVKVSVRTAQEVEWPFQSEAGVWSLYASAMFVATN